MSWWRLPVCVFPLVCFGSCGSSPTTIKDSPEEIVARQTTELPRVNKAVVYLLDDVEDSKTGRDFPIRPYGSFAPILKERTLTDGQAEELAETWRTREFGGGGALCHYPAYGLRLYAGNEMVLETSLCWKCWNCFVFDGETEKSAYRWLGFVDQDNKLLNQLGRVIPLPEPEKSNRSAKSRPSKS